MRHRFLAGLALIACLSVASPVRAQIVPVEVVTYAGPVYWPGYVIAYPYWYGWQPGYYSYPMWYGGYSFAMGPVWQGWHTGPYYYPYRPYASWFTPVIYFPGAYYFPTPHYYFPVVSAAAATPTADRVPAKADGKALYAQGLEEYRDGRYAKAQALLERSVEASDADPRAWYFLALTRWALGDLPAGDEAARQGAAIERLGTFEKGLIARSLESVQGRWRYRLEDAARSMSRAEAAAAVAARRTQPADTLTARAK
jgi:tetratricopeptide (TPR) repeat protein